MTIEEKLDIIFEYVKSGKFIEGQIDKDEGVSQDILCFEKIYGKFEFCDGDHYWKLRNEFEQLLQKLTDDGIIERDFIYDSIVTLTITGKLFDGYVKEKERRKWNERLTKWQTILVSVGAIFAIIFGSMEAYDRLTPRDPSSETMMNHILLNQPRLSTSVDSLYLQVNELQVRIQKLTPTPVLNAPIGNAKPK